MKKLITTYLLFLFFSTQPIIAQFEITGSEDFGRIFDLTYDINISNTVYAVTQGNHILVSEDNGDTWDILYSLTIGQGASVKDLKLTPDGTALTFSVYLANSTENALMVYDIASTSIIKTIPLPNQSDLAFINSYDFYDGDMDVLLLDTAFPEGIGTEAKVYYTEDGGDTWDMIYYSTDNNRISVGNVVISPNNPHNIFITRGNGKENINGGLLVSDDAGQTIIEKLPGIVLGPISFDPSDDQTLLIGTGISFGSSDENLYKSIDGGNTFEVVPISWTEGILDCINVIRYNAFNPSQIIILEENEVVISEDSGATWQNFVYLEDNPEVYYYGLNASFNPYNSEEVYISGNYFPFFSSEGGRTLNWTKSPFYSSTGNMDLYSDVEVASLYYGVQFGYVHRNLFSGEETTYDIMPLNYVSNNPGITQYADKITPNRIYTFKNSFMGSNLSVSDDNGATKTQLASLFKNNFTCVATYPNLSSTILAAFAGFERSETVLRRYDFSDINNVVETDIELPILDVINGILIDEEGIITLAVGVNVFSSIDDGVTWINNSDGLEDLSTSEDLIFDLKRDPLNVNRLALGTSKGVYISNDGGQFWEQKSNDLIFNLSFSTESEGGMVGTTYSSEVSEFALHFSVDNGETWQTISNEQLLYISGRSSAYLFEEDSVKVFVGSFDLGLVSYTIDLTPLGSPSFSESDEIEVFPNPAKDFVNIRANGDSLAEVVLFTLSGQQVLQTTNDNVEVINISQLEPGIYLLRAITVTDDVYFKRIIVQ